MEKKRIFYLDFIRAVAMLMIVNYHFFAEYFLKYDIIINGIGGIVGVSIFFVISGASLMYQYKDEFEIKSYLKKRFLGIYPMFWIAYSLVFLYIFYGNKGFFLDLPIYKLGISVLGMDGYLSVYTKTFYLIGEWFIGCIVLIYLLFPFFRMAMKKYPKIFFLIATLVNLMVIFFSHFKMPLNYNLVVCSYSFLFGMYWIEYHPKLKLKYAIVAMIFCVIVWYLNTNTPISVIIVGNLIGYGLMFVLSYVGEKIKGIFLKNVIQELSRYSYAIFLTHHFVIMKLLENFVGINLDKYGVLCVYIMSWVVIGISSKALYELNRKAISLLKPMKIK